VDSCRSRELRAILLAMRVRRQPYRLRIGAVGQIGVDGELQGFSAPFPTRIIEERLNKPRLANTPDRPTSRTILPGWRNRSRNAFQSRPALQFRRSRSSPPVRTRKLPSTLIFPGYAFGRIGPRAV